jgi:hypothetical protein
VIGEAGGAYPPRSVHRTIQDDDPATYQLLANCIRVVDRNRELESRSGIATGNGGRRDQLSDSAISKRLIRVLLNRTLQRSSSGSLFLLGKGPLEQMSRPNVARQPLTQIFCRQQSGGS